MRFILIDPYLKRIDELDIDDELPIFRRLIGCENLDAVPCRIDNEKLALWVDDEGIYHEAKRWALAKNLPKSNWLEPGKDFSVIHGRGLLVGYQTGGQHCDPKIDLLRLAEFVIWGA
jgi:hypothetical protein